MVVQAPSDATQALAAFRPTLLALDLPVGQANRIGTALRQLEAGGDRPVRLLRAAARARGVGQPGAEAALLIAAEEVRLALGC